MLIQLDENEQLIIDCMNREDRLNDWEREFIQSLAEQIDQGRTLTTNQTDVLETVWDKATEKG